jgi:hypothetical protein
MLLQFHEFGGFEFLVKISAKDAIARAIHGTS